MKKTTLALALITALLLSATTGTIIVNVAKANFVFSLPEIVIKSDGTIEPETEFINQTGNLYSLTGNLSQKYAIKIQRSNIVFDGAGCLINGTVTKGYGFVGPGFLLDGVTNVTVKDIEVIGFSGEDILVQGGSNCSLLRLKSPVINFMESDFNTVAETTGYLHFESSNNNSITRNNIIGSLGLSSSNGNAVSKNNITGISVIQGSSFNLLFANNFLGSNLFEFGDKANSWDNGSVGNYWRDYLTRYPNATEIGSTGIGDIPYVIDAENQDNYPLMAPYETPPSPESRPEPEPFPTTAVAAVSGASVAIVGVGLFYHFRKRNR